MSSAERFSSGITGLGSPQQWQRRGFGAGEQQLDEESTAGWQQAPQQRSVPHGVATLWQTPIAGTMAIRAIAVARVRITEFLKLDLRMAFIQSFKPPQIVSSRVFVHIVHGRGLPPLWHVPRGLESTRRAVRPPDRDGAERLAVPMKNTVQKQGRSARVPR